MTPIKIDLRNLTQAHIDAAAATGEVRCLYTAPCIIGSLMTDDERKLLQSEGRDATRLSKLIWKNRVEVDDDQRNDAETLQKAFDNGDFDLVAEIAAPWIAA